MCVYLDFYFSILNNKQLVSNCILIRFQLVTKDFKAFAKLTLDLPRFCCRVSIIFNRFLIKTPGFQW